MDAPPVAEVIESSTRHVVAEVLKDQEAPPFGTWVEIETQEGVVLYALVSHAETGSVEPGRQAVALGRSRDEIRREMPHVFELIRTTFRAVVLGYWDGRSRTPEGAPRVHQTLPPRPAALHDFVRPCGPEAVARLGAPYDFLRSLATFPDPAVPADDLLAAVLRGLRRAHGDGDPGQRAVLDAGRALARLLHDDHERLQSILRRV
ncbi:MAG: HAS-barrel domain-containing protein [Rubricoccaceae bacterium]|nr:HAS-barrel domain-containing protein [Rubricoccaceae bacterium]